MDNTTYNPSRDLLGVAMGFMVTLSACGNEQAQQPQETAPQAIPVATKSLESSQVTTSSEFLGRLEATERVNLAPRVDGRITNIAVQEGDRVTKGQVIAQLQQTREQAEVDAAVSQVNIIQADLVNAQSQVKAAQAEVAQAEAEVAQARADLRRQQADVSLAETNIERARFLVGEGAESKQYLDDRTQALDSASARRDALQQAVNASEKALIAAREGVRAAMANVDREKASLNQAIANVGVASENLGYNSVTAPIDGIVGNIVPKEGDYLEAGNQITTITSNDNLTVNIAVPIEEANRLEIGLPVEITNSIDGEPIVGTITFISPTTTQESILVKASVANEGQLQDDQAVLANIIWSEQPGILVPTTAISRIAGENFIFVARQSEGEGETNLVAEQRLVKLGNIQGQEYQVISGLQPGDRIVTNGIINLTDGVPIAEEQQTAQQQIPVTSYQ